MSEFKKYQTQYRDLECLKAALIETGCDQIKEHKTPQPLESYFGRNTKVDVQAKRNHHVFGFVKNSDGMYDAVVEEDNNSSRKGNAAWMTDVKKAYTEKVTVKEAKRAGLKPYKVQMVGNKKVIQYLVN